jgi:hypothetical protein
LHWEENESRGEVMWSDFVLKWSELQWSSWCQKYHVH